MLRFLWLAAALAAITVASVITPTGIGAARAAPAIPRFARPTVPLQASVPAAANQIAAADFNGDGLVDVVIARLGSVSTDTFPVTVLLNRGNGRFVDATKSIFVGAPPRTQHPRQIVIADFNGDGRPDAFIADHGSDQLPFPGFPNTLILS
jgi:hypothetical protein